VNSNNTLKTGGDPRTLPDYAALRDELAKLSHPARPDVDWCRIEHLSLSLFRQNGVELQTAAWYTLARIRLAGMAGLNEGLAMLETLLTQQWGVLWPQPIHARMEILAGFSQRLQSVLRTLNLHYVELPLVYQAERHLNAMCDVLQRLELRNASQMAELSTFMHNSATRLENINGEYSDNPAVVLPVSSASPMTSQVEPPVYFSREESAIPGVVTVAAVAGSRHPWRAFAAGMATMLVVGTVGLWGWQKIYPEPSSPVPLRADASSLKVLGQLSPLWRQEYGFMLAASAELAETDKLKLQWQQYIDENALPSEALSGWHQGMEGLKELTRRLNELDERKGKYLTGSELKSMVFAITQSFGHTVPIEEQLYRLERDITGESLPSAILLQTDIYLNQLMNRYVLIKQLGK